MIALLFAATMPVILILLYVYHKDKNKEPLALLIKLFLSGFLACFLVVIISDILKMIFPFMTIENKTIFETLLYSFIGVALVEETCKWLMVMLVGYTQNDFDETFDILIYSVFVSLGFAFIENIIYVISIQSLRTALMRAISAVPSHACDAVFMGYFLSIAKQKATNKRREQEKKYMILSIIVPTLLHGFYDFLIMANFNGSSQIFIVFVIILFLISINRLRQLSYSNKSLRKRNRFCSNCGRLIDSNLCKNCGTFNTLYKRK